MPNHAERQLELPQSVLGSTSRGDHVREAINFIERETGVPSKIRRIAGVVRIYPDPSYLPSRTISREEALARNWPSYYIASPCLNSHLAPRWTHGSGCIDCDRIKRNKLPIGIQLITLDETSETNASGAPAQSSGPL